MNRNNNAPIQDIAEEYLHAKANFDLFLDSSRPLDSSASLETSEKELEVAFNKLLETQSESLETILVKSKIFINEILNEAELTRYHQKALKNLIDELTRLVNQRQ